MRARFFARLGESGVIEVALRKAAGIKSETVSANTHFGYFPRQILDGKESIASGGKLRARQFAKFSIAAVRPHERKCGRIFGLGGTEFRPLFSRFILILRGFLL